MTAEHRARARCRIRPTTAEPLAAPQQLNRRASLKGMRRKTRRGLNIPGPGAAARGPRPLLSRGGSEGGSDTGPRPALGHGRAAADHAVDPLMQESPSDACMWALHWLQHRERRYGNAWDWRMEARRTASDVLTPIGSTPPRQANNGRDAPAQRTGRFGGDRNRPPASLPCLACRLHGCWRHARSIRIPYQHGSMGRFRLEHATY